MKYKLSSGWIKIENATEGGIGADVNIKSTAHVPYRLKFHKFECPYSDMSLCYHFTTAGYPFYNCYAGQKFTLIFNGDSIALKESDKDFKLCSLNSNKWLLAIPGIPLSYENDQLLVFNFKERSGSNKYKCTFTKYNLKNIDFVLKSHIQLPTNLSDFPHWKLLQRLFSFHYENLCN